LQIPHLLGTTVALPAATPVVLVPEETLVLRLALSAVVAAVLWISLSAAAFGQDPPTSEPQDPAKTPAMLKDVADAAGPAKQAGNIAWIIVATALVFLMMPGLALFYGGMVRRKNVLGTMMHTMIALGIVGVQWMVVGYCLAFGVSQDGYIGWSKELVLLSPELASKTFPGLDIPVYLHAMFQGMFAIITAALVSGAFAERVKFGAYCLFILLWTTLVYDPLAHWVWALPWDADGQPGWLGKMGAIDFAGGTVVHIAAGFAGLAAILVLRKRHGYPQHAFHPNSMVLTLLGAGLLWFGWFGFNAGSALGSSIQAVNALTVTQVAAAAAGLAWVLTEWCLKGKPTALGFASGVVAGLVAITPASGFVAPGGALVIGLLAGILCYGAVLLKPMLGYDDSLDAFGVHGVGGFLGAVLTGALVSIPVWMAGTGLAEDKFPGKLTDGKWDVAAQVKTQVIASLVSAAFSFVVTAVLVLLIDKTIGFTVPEKDESVGLDLAEHGEVGFDYGGASLEEMPGAAVPEPKAASTPPNGPLSKRFTVTVEGADPAQLVKVWSDLCKPADAPPSPSFAAVYPYFTTVSGNKFRFRGGDPVALRGELQKLLSAALGGQVKTTVES
jgi:ammonium transporter